MTFKDILDAGRARFINRNRYAQFEQELFDKIRGSELKADDHCYIFVIRRGEMPKKAMRAVQSYLGENGIKLVWLVVSDVAQFQIAKVELPEKIPVRTVGCADMNALAHDLKRLVKGMKDRTGRDPDAADILPVLKRHLEPTE